MANSQKKSSALKLLNGNAGKHKDESPAFTASNKDLPVAPPKKLSDGAKIVWKKVRKIIQESQSEIYNNLDVLFLERYCELKSKWQECLDHMLENGMTSETISTTKTGEYTITKETPEYKLFKNLNPILNKMENELGLTPQGRRSLGIETVQGKEPSPLEKLLNRKMQKG